MAKVKAGELKKGDKISMAGKEHEIVEIEVSDLGKQGKKKVRIVAKPKEGESLTLIRPDDYPIEKV